MQAMTGQLLAVANELIRARERVALGESGGGAAAVQPPGRPAAPAPGSIEAAVEQLELYRNVLENRVRPGPRAKSAAGCMGCCAPAALQEG